MTTQVYLASTLDYMYNNNQKEEVDTIVNKSTCNKLGDIIYFIINEETSSGTESEDTSK